MKPNKLRELLKAGKPSLGTRVIIPWPRLVEIIANTCSLDYIEYVSEYSTYDIEQLENFGRAIELFPNMSSMIKIEEQTRGFIAQRALDAGIQNVLFSDCRDAKDVRECIRLVRPETPAAGGIHGAGSRRVHIGSNTGEWVNAMNNAVLVFMIEKKSAIDNLEEILSVKGVDMVQFGPNDYTVSVGIPDQGHTPEIRKVQEDMIKMALKKGVAPRVEISNFEMAKPFIDMGVRHFSLSSDIAIIAQWYKQQAPSLRKQLT